MPSSGCCARCSPAPWPACKFPPGSSPNVWVRAAVLALGTALAGVGYCLAGASAGLGLLAGRAVHRRHGREHAASAGLVADGARLRRPALDEGARHLQFRRRHRQDDRAGGGLAAAAGDVVAAGAGAARRARPRGRGGDLRADAALRRRDRREGAPDSTRPGGRAWRAPSLRLSRAAHDRHARQRDPHGLPAVPAVPAHRQGRERADRRARADAGVRRRRGRQAGLRLHRRAHRRHRRRSGSPRG